MWLSCLICARLNFGSIPVFALYTRFLCPGFNSILVLKDTEKQNREWRRISPFHFRLFSSATLSWQGLSRISTNKRPFKWGGNTPFKEQPTGTIQTMSIILCFAHGCALVKTNRTRLEVGSLSLSFPLSTHIFLLKTARNFYNDIPLPLSLA